MITEYIAMFFCLPNLKKIVNLLAESLPFTQIYLRTLLLRIHIDKLNKVAGECMKDYRVSAFENPEEIYIFMGYIRKGKFYVKIGASFVFAASTSWFLRPITSSAPATTIIPATNETPAQFIYNLPYKFHIFYEINDYFTYLLTYMSWSPFLYISCIGSITSQIMIIAFAYHVSGKLAVLATRINALKNTKNGLRQNLAKILSEHSRLLEMGEGIKVSFAMALLTYLIVGTIQICIIGYHILVIITTRQQRNLMPLFTFILTTYFVISIYCILSEHLLAESQRCSEAYWNCEWCDMPLDCIKDITFCIMRSQKTLGLTAGAFVTLSNSTLTDVTKAAMGYLSILRNFLTE